MRSSSIKVMHPAYPFLPISYSNEYLPRSSCVTRPPVTSTGLLSLLLRLQVCRNYRDVDRVVEAWKWPPAGCFDLLEEMFHK